jgi:hypothetical protein
MKAGFFALALMLLTTPAFADTAAADCTITPKGETTEPEKRPCTFGQRQGYVDVRFVGEDENFLELSPTQGAGNYLDQNGDPAYRNKGLGNKGLVFNGEFGTVRVYWSDRPLR